MLCLLSLVLSQAGLTQYTKLGSTWMGVLTALSVDENMLMRYRNRQRHYSFWKTPLSSPRPNYNLRADLKLARPGEAAASYCFTKANHRCRRFIGIRQGYAHNAISNSWKREDWAVYLPQPSLGKEPTFDYDIYHYSRQSRWHSVG